MNWKNAYRSFYYQGAPEPEDLSLPPDETALLCIVVQSYGVSIGELREMAGPD
jgi:hypothetical protein